MFKDKKSLIHLQELNTFPIVFIGSGISKRYIQDFPSWIELLEKAWHYSKISNDFYGRLATLKDESFSNYFANIKIASEIESAFNSNFRQGIIKIDSLSTKTAYENNISPFKYYISSLFQDLKYTQTYEKEKDDWHDFITKSRFIITTNYDEFIEDTYSDSHISLKKFVGNRGFFSETTGYAELYKIHGCISEPNSIILTENDYSKFDEESILISSKIISALVCNPIIFIGYSLSDKNVQKIISNFTKQIPEHLMADYARKIIVVTYEEHIEYKEQIVQKDFGTFTNIITDDFTSIYKAIASIQQGLTPDEINRFQSFVKKIIIEKGSEGNLDSYLISPKELDTMNNNSNLVVAIGDRKNFYVLPDYVSYIEDYMFNKDELLPNLALQFIAFENTSARTPFLKYLQNFSLDSSTLSSKQKKRIQNKLNSEDNLPDNIINKIPKSDKVKFTSVKAILDCDVKFYKKLNRLIYNMYDLPLEDIESLIKGDLIEIIKDKSRQSLHSTIRKLIWVYDNIKFER